MTNYPSDRRQEIFQFKSFDICALEIETCFEKRTSTNMTNSCATCGQYFVTMFYFHCSSYLLRMILKLRIWFILNFTILLIHCILPGGSRQKNVWQSVKLAARWRITVKQQFPSWYRKDSLFNEIPSF